MQRHAIAEAFVATAWVTPVPVMRVRMEYAEPALESTVEDQYWPRATPKKVPLSASLVLVYVTFNFEKASSIVPRFSAAHSAAVATRHPDGQGLLIPFTPC